MRDIIKPKIKEQALKPHISIYLKYSSSLFNSKQSVLFIV